MNDCPRLVELPGRPAVTRVLVPVAFGALLAGTGAITAVSPPVGLAVGIGAFCTSLLRLGERLRAVFLVVMAGLLIGYAFFGRTFAYLGVPPFYVGEAVLGLGLLSLIPAGRRLEVGKLEWLVIGRWAESNRCRQLGLGIACGSVGEDAFCQSGGLSGCGPSRDDFEYRRDRSGAPPRPPVRPIRPKCGADVARAIHSSIRYSRDRPLR